MAMIVAPAAKIAMTKDPLKVLATGAAFFEGLDVIDSPLEGGTLCT